MQHHRGALPADGQRFRFLPVGYACGAHDDELEQFDIWIGCHLLSLLLLFLWKACLRRTSGIGQQRFLGAL